MNAQEFEAKYYEDGEVYGDDVKCIVEGDDEVNHKTVYNTCVYRVGDEPTAEYFEVVFSRSNGGYWGDSERYDPEFRKVVPEVETITRVVWKGV